MIAADAEAIAVAARDEHRQAVIGELHAGGHGQGPAVQGVHAISVYESGEIGRTPDAADGDHFMIGHLQFHQGLFHGREHTEISAAGAPVGLNFAFQAGQGYLAGSLYACRHRGFLLKP